MNLVKFDESKRQELVELGKRDLFFFCKGILGFRDLSDEFHWELSRFMMRGYDPRLREEVGEPESDRWNRALVCSWRGSLKSSVANIGFIAHQSAYVENHSTLLIEQKSDNARVNHFQPISDLFRNSRQADFLQWLFRHRIPEGFAGWTTEQIAFLSDDPLSPPSLRYGGIDSAFEGVHVNLIVVDDPEGADAEKGDAPNADSYRLVMQRCPPLLINPDRDRILLIATPHGADPIVHKVREKASSVFAIFWKEVIDSTGRSRWPERFTDRVLATLKIDRELWDKQYMLLKSSGEEAYFDMELVERFLYEWPARNQLISYPVEEFNPDKLDDEGYPEVMRRRSTIALGACRFYMHCDPKHKDRGESITRPSEAAVLVVAVSPDFHVFTVETWADEVGLEKFAERIYHLYRKWSPSVVTMEMIGAQAWFRDYARVLEKDKYRTIKSLPRYGRPALPLPRLTTRLVEAKKGNESKEEYIMGLQSWLHSGRLHLNAELAQLLAQVRSFPETTALKDLLDCLAQGPAVWRAPVGYHPLNELRGRKRLLDLVQVPDPITGYQCPWNEATN